MPYRGLRHDFNLSYARGSLTDTCTDAVRTGISATDNEYSFTSVSYTHLPKELLSPELLKEETDMEKLENGEF